MPNKSDLYVSKNIVFKEIKWMNLWCHTGVLLRKWEKQWCPWKNECVLSKQSETV